MDTPTDGLFYMVDRGTVEEQTTRKKYVHLDYFGHVEILKSAVNQATRIALASDGESTVLCHTVSKEYFMKLLPLHAFVKDAQQQQFALGACPYLLFQCAKHLSNHCSLMQSMKLGNKKCVGGVMESRLRRHRAPSRQARLESYHRAERKALMHQFELWRRSNGASVIRFACCDFSLAATSLPHTTNLHHCLNMFSAISYFLDSTSSRCNCSSKS